MLRRWVTPLLVVAAIVAPAHAAAEITPPAAIEFEIAPIEPIAPIDPAASGEPDGAGNGPTAPRPPRAPQLPSAPDPAADVTNRVDAVVSKVAALSTRIAGAGLGDGTGLSQLDSAALLDALRDGRNLFATGAPTSAPQTAVDGTGCPTDVPAGTLRDGAENIGAAALCAKSVRQAATPEAARAIEWAFRQLGAPYACDGVGRLEQYRFDCSSLVTRAYSEGAGLNTAGENWAPSTRDLMPWDGVPLADWAAFVSPQDARPGDLLLYRSCTTPPCSYQHVVMMLADGYMLHTNRCGDVAHVKRATGFDPSDGFVVARRVDPEKAR